MDEARQRMSLVPWVLTFRVRLEVLECTRRIALAVATEVSVEAAEEDLAEAAGTCK